MWSVAHFTVVFAERIVVQRQLEEDSWQVVSSLSEETERERESCDFWRYIGDEFTASVEIFTIGLA